MASWGTRRPALLFIGVLASLSIGIFHLEATLTISFTVLTWLSMYTDLLSLVALLTLKVALALIPELSNDGKGQGP